jgi:hypothetical protein
MKKILYLSIAFIFISASSCNKDFLNLEPLDQYADGAVWNEDPALIQAFVNAIYRGFGQQGIRTILGTYVDETMLTFGMGADDITNSLMTPSYLGLFAENPYSQSSFYVWDVVYKNIRSCNLFLQKIESAKAVTDVEKEKLKGEVYFLRAYLYNMLVSMYGGVPIIDKAYGLGEDYAVPRNTYEECIEFIVADCDRAIEKISNPEKGRPTKGAAMALKSRVLLYAASDLYNNNAAYAGGYANPELIGYVGGDRSARWQRAKDAAKAVMDLNQYSLYKADPAPGDNIAANYGNIFLLTETSEDIFIKYYVANVVSTLVMPNLNNGPSGYHLRGANTPIGQLVDDYEMSDGTKFSWANPEQAAHPYINREPRFYASINYDGAKWYQRPDDVRGIDPIGVIQTSYVERWNSQTNSVDIISGLETRTSPSDDWNGTYTGYVMRKHMDPTIDARFVPQTNPWRFIRYTEVLLNYAEACLGLNQEDEAKIYINMIRKRAGLPPVTETGQALVDRYRHERRIELAFEDHRFFDVRRWMIAPEAYKNAQGIKIVHKLNPDKVTTTPTYTILPSVQNRAWKDCFYFIPISLSEMNRNNKLIQNPLY